MGFGADMGEVAGVGGGVAQDPPGVPGVPMPCSCASPLTPHLDPMAQRSIAWADLSPDTATAPLHGGMGLVFRATWRPRGSPPRAVAVKLLPRLLSAHLQDLAARLEAEAATMAAAQDGLNEFVAALYGMARGAPTEAWLGALGHYAASVLTPLPGAGSGGSGGGSGSGSGGSAPSQELLGLVLRWEEGGTLASLLHSPERAWGGGTPERLLLCAQLASGLCCLHAATVIHGDIKGDNVLLSDRSATPHPRISDFGLAELRAAAAASSISSLQEEAAAKRGTWPYMAPEMYRSRAAPAAKASRTTDVYALATLCWEVLSGARPWEGFVEADRLVDLRDGGGLSLESPPLPIDTPAAVKALLATCLSADRAARPRAARMAEVLHQEAQKMGSETFDVFLSHSWGEDDQHAPLTTEVYLRLLDAGLRVWLDTEEMGANPEESMKKGIAASGCVVALLSERYGTRPNCLKELAWAREQGKPVVGCLADATPGWFPSAGGALAALLDPATNFFPDLREVAGVEWAPASGEVPAAQRELLTKAPTALPKVLTLVREKLGGGVAGAGEVVPVPAHCSQGASSGAGAIATEKLAATENGSGVEAAAVPVPAPLGSAGAAGEGGSAAVYPGWTGGQLKGHCVAQLKHGGRAYGLAVVGGQLLSGGTNKHMCVWDLRTGQNVATIAGKGYSIAALPGGRFATAPGNASPAAVWDAATATRICELQGHTGNVRCVASVPGDLVATGSSDETVRIWRAATGVHVSTLKGHTDCVNALAMLPDGHLASGSYDNTVRLWDLFTRTCTAVLQHDSTVYALASLNGSCLASGCGDNKIYLWNPTSGAREALLEGHTRWVRSLAALLPGLLASGSEDKTVRVWNVAARTCVAVLRGHASWVWGLAALPDGRLASGGYGDDDEIRVWKLQAAVAAEFLGADSAAGGEVAGVAAAQAAAPAPMPASLGVGAGAARVVRGQLTGHCVAQIKNGDSATGLAVVGGQLVSGGYKHDHLRVWDPRTGQNVATMAGRGYRIAALSGGRFATAAGNAPTAAVWDAATATRICELQGHTWDVKCVASVAGDLVATGSDDKTIRIWHAAAGAHVATLKGHTDWVFALAMLPDGRLASGSRDDTVRLWDLSTHACTAVLQHPLGVYALAALEGDFLASGCWNSKIYLWNPTSGAREGVLEGHTDSVASLVALPQGLLASGSLDTTARVWNVAARTCVAVLQGHTGGGVFGLAALPDGRLASGSFSNDDVIRVWELQVAVAPATLGGGNAEGGEGAGIAAAQAAAPSFTPASLTVGVGADASGGGSSAAMYPGWMGGQLTGHCVAQPKHGGGVSGLAVVEGQLVSGGQHLRVWNPRTGQNVANIAGRGYRIAALPCGRFATATFFSSTAAVWDAATATCICELHGHTGTIECVVSVPGDLVATGSCDKTLRIWRSATGAHVATLEGHTDRVCALAMLPDSRLASGSSDKTVRLWDLSTCTCTAVLQHDSAVYTLATLNGGFLASGCADKKIHLWNPTSGAHEALLEGHTGYVRSLAALPQGLLASGSEDKTVRVWNMAARSCVAVLQGHTASVDGLAALPDGRLASGSRGEDDVIRVWELELRP